MFFSSKISDCIWKVPSEGTSTHSSYSPKWIQCKLQFNVCTMNLSIFPSESASTCASLSPSVPIHEYKIGLLGSLNSGNDDLSVLVECQSNLPKLSIFRSLKFEEIISNHLISQKWWQNISNFISSSFSSYMKPFDIWTNIFFNHIANIFPCSIKIYLLTMEVFVLIIKKMGHIWVKWKLSPAN